MGDPLALIGISIAGFDIYGMFLSLVPSIKTDG
jgi:hypothetical protein